MARTGDPDAKGVPLLMRLELMTPSGISLTLAQHLGAESKDVRLYLRFTIDVPEQGKLLSLLAKLGGNAIEVRPSPKPGSYYTVGLPLDAPTPGHVTELALRVLRTAEAAC